MHFSHALAPYHQQCRARSYSWCQPCNRFCMQFSGSQSPRTGFYQFKRSNCRKTRYFQPLKLIGIEFFLIQSDILSTGTFIDFYVDLVVCAMAATTTITTMITAACFHFGMCFYIMEMIKDLSAQMANINEFSRSEESKLGQKARFRQKIIKEIQFHAKIIEYDHLVKISTNQIRL